VRIVLGLGNPGPRYARTRHNAGFLVVDRLRSEAGVRWSDRDLRQEALVRIGGEEFVLARPLTFMNKSGAAAALLLAEHGVGPREMLVVSDDVALPEGKLRIRSGGGPGGHKGLLSIREEIGAEEFPRLRIGVGAPEGVDLAEYVLDPLDGEEWERLETAVAEAAEAVRVICLSGLTKAMNRFHRPPEEDPAES
jgi:PTH1 family peptidyl-tRNA hydrolase